MNHQIPIVKHISETFIKPKLHDIKKSNNKQSLFLTPWDLKLLSLHYNQKGLLYKKPTPQNDGNEPFSFDNLVESLKDSLALTLVHFYPLAGQLATKVDHDRHEFVVYVDCNKGPGVQFIQATLDVTISDIVSPTYIPRIVFSLFDHDDGTIVNLDGRSRPLLSVQVTELVDGIFIGCSMNHVVLDGTSLWHFWNVWSKIHSAKTNPSSIPCPPVIDRRWFEHFQSSAIPFTNDPDEFVVRYEPSLKLKERIFHFPFDSIKKLKLRANKDIDNKNITISSFQALAALTWRAFVRANGLEPHEVTNCSLAINVRRRLDPPLPEYYFGNAADTVPTTTTVGELLGNSLGWAALLLHETIHGYNSDAAVGLLNCWMKSPSFFDLSKVSDSRSIKHGSSPRFDVYGNEFGSLGRPVAVRSGFGNKFAGKVSSYPACEGGGSVDVEICLLPKAMANLESDQEFMDVVSVKDNY